MSKASMERFSIDTGNRLMVEFNTEDYLTRTAARSVKAL